MWGAAHALQRISRRHGQLHHHWLHKPGSGMPLPSPSSPAPALPSPTPSQCGSVPVRAACCNDQQHLGRSRPGGLDLCTGYPCSPLWAGVVCASGLPAGLELDGLALSGTLPDQLGFVTSLRSIDLSGSALTGSLPASWSLLTGLTALLLHGGNQLSGTSAAGPR